MPMRYAWKENLGGTKRHLNLCPKLPYLGVQRVLLSLIDECDERVGAAVRRQVQRLNNFWSRHENLDYGT